MYIMKSKKKQKRRGGDSNLESCTDTLYSCYGSKDGETKYCEQWKPGSVCYSNKCHTPANCIYGTNPDIKAQETRATDPLKDADPLKATDLLKDADPSNATVEKSGSNNLINGVAGIGAMYMGYKWLNKKKASSDDSSSPEKKKSSRQKRKSSRRKRKSSHRKSISHR